MYVDESCPECEEVGEVVNIEDYSDHFIKMYGCYTEDCEVESYNVTFEPVDKGVMS